MTVKEILAELKSLGDQKRVANDVKSTYTTINLKNYSPKKGDHFGVKMGDIRKIAKKAKVDHQRALELWKTGNVEARHVAILTMKPKELSKKELTSLAKSIKAVWVADWFSNYVLKDHPNRSELRGEWIKSKDKWAARFGWSLTAGKVARDSDDLDIGAVLTRLEKELPKAAPAVQWTMNTTLANIGIHHPKHRKKAIALGNKMKLYKEYPVPKGCVSPFAPIWIEEMVKKQRGD